MLHIYLNLSVNVKYSLHLISPKYLKYHQTNLYIPYKLKPSMEPQRIAKRGNIKIYVVSGDATQWPTTALLTAIGKDGPRSSSLTRAIRRIGNDFYYNQINKSIKQNPPKELDVVLAEGDGISLGCGFDNLVAVVDEFNYSVDKVVYAGLKATLSGYDEINVPQLRLGDVRLQASREIIEKTPEEVVRNIARGIDAFNSEFTISPLKRINIVAYRDRTVFDLLVKGLKEYFSA
jgi:hypothetical protein